MARRHIKQRAAMMVAVLASLSFVFAAVYVYQVPGDTVVRYLLTMLVLLLGVMAVAAALVAVVVIIRKHFKR